MKTYQPFHSLLIGLLLTFSGIVPLHSEAPALPPKSAEDARKELALLVRHRFEDFEAKLQTSAETSLRAQSRAFIENRKDQIESVSRKIAATFNERLKTGELDATQLKADKELAAYVRKLVGEIVDPDRVEREAEQWAGDVEAKARELMIRCLQITIAKDLAKHFDENYRGRLIEAVNSIHMSDLAKNADLSEVENMILRALPEAAISKTTREFVKGTVQALAAAAARASLAAEGVPLMSFTSIVGGQAVSSITGLIVGPVVDGLNRMLTANADPAKIEFALKRGLLDWHQHNMITKLREKSSDFDQNIIDSLEEKILSENGLLDKSAP